MLVDPLDEVTRTEIEFLQHSNWIENEFSHEALVDAVRAWLYMMNQGNIIFSLGTILGAHRILMRRIRPDIAGKIRECDVTVGERLCPFVSVQLIEQQLRDLCNVMKEPPTVSTDTEIYKLCHINFENIHPFEDGNGRVGRILYNAHRLANNKDIHIIHQGKEQVAYYKWFK